MNLHGNILIVDDDPGVLVAARLALAPHVAQIETLATPDGLDDAVAARNIDVVLLDMNFSPGAHSGQDGLDWLDRLRRLAPDVSVVIMTAYGGVALAVETLKMGAVDFVLKPWQNEKLVATVSAAVALARARRETAGLRLRNVEATVKAGEMIGSAPSLQPVFKLIQRAAPTSANILILGEAGVGKEQIARELHRLSHRSDQPFISVDLSSVPEATLESELFGHRRGAFAGADVDRAGRIQAANGGTLYLDEIGVLPFHLQRKLYAVLERGEVVPVGAMIATAVDVRVVAGSHRPLTDLEREDVICRDLLDRLRMVEISVPALRDRREDIPLLLEHFLSFYARKHNVARRRLSPEVLRRLESYSWPGNIRELRHATERATLLVGDERLELQDFPFVFNRVSQSSEQEIFELEEIERQAIGRAMTHFNGNITQAATALGLTRPALYRRLEKHGF